MLSFDIDLAKKTLVCKYSPNQRVKLGTRVLTKVTSVDIPQKQVYLDVKEIIRENKENRENNMSHKKKLEKK